MAGPQCCENPPALNPTYGAGTVEKLAGLNTYLTGPSQSKLAILLISDVFGYEAPNLRKLADKVAAAGYLVVVPDFFDGDYFKLDPDFDRQAWIAKHGMDKGSEDAKTVITALRSRGVASVGAAGFCWGGSVVLKLANSVYYIQAGVALHPGPLQIDEINEIKVPISILGAEDDSHCTPEQVTHVEEILATKSDIESFVKIFPGVSHGWSVRYDVEDASAVENAKEAHSNMLNWFVKHVK